MIRYRLLGAINLPAMIHAIRDPKPSSRGDKPAGYGPHGAESLLGFRM